MTATPHALELSLRDAAPGDLLRAVGREAAELAALVASVGDAQWTTPPRTGSGSGRSAGGVSNPTADIATDAQRLRLRAEVVAAERIMRDSAVALRTHRTAVERALEPYGEAGE